MDRLRRSWALAGSSWRVLREDKELLLLPVVSGVAAVLCVAPFLAGSLVLGVAGASASEPTFAPGVAGWVLAAVGYLVGAYVTIFFQAALIHAANERLAGGDPTLGSAIAGAASRAASDCSSRARRSLTSWMLPSIAANSSVPSRLALSSRREMRRSISSMPLSVNGTAPAAGGANWATASDVREATRSASAS